MDQHAEILVDIADRLVRLTVNRPRALNALTRPMVRRLGALFAAWRDDPDVAVVVARGEGERAFCSGGDVRAVYEAGRAGRREEALAFFHDEYRMNWRLFRFPKPYVALVDGITMGGGVGISVHGRFRVVTERALFAMPETGIGLFPDVGGTYFLPRCPGALGTYLALTGARLKAADCLYVGYATHFVPSERLGEVEAALREAAAAGGDAAAAAVEEALAPLSGDPGPPPLAEHRETIDRCFAHDRVEDILAALADERGDDGGWAAETRADLMTKSPTSLKVTLSQMRRGAGLDFDAAMRLEYRMVHRIVAGHDFYEGIRALLVDKDGEPRWDPASLSGVTEDDVERYFAPVPEAAELALDWED
jgi:enoyl-CoA hydratase